MGEILHLVHVADKDRHLIALLDLDLLHAEHGCHRVHVDPHLVAVAHDLVGVFQLDAVLFGLRAGILPERVVAIPDVNRVDLGDLHDRGVVRFGEAGTVVNEAHLLAGDIDQLIAFRLQGTDVDEAVLGELVQGQQPFAVGLLGLAHGCVVVAGLVVDVELLDDRIDLLALVGADRLARCSISQPDCR